VPEAWIQSTVQIGLNVRMKGVVTATAGATSVAALTEGVLSTMLTSKLRLAFSYFLGATLVTLTTGVLLGQVRKDAPRSVPNAGAGRPETEPNELDTLKTSLLEAARARLKTQRSFYEEGRITLDRFVKASASLLDVECLVSETKTERLKALREYVERAKQIEAREQAENEVGRGTLADLTEARLHRLQAEYQLANALKDSSVEELDQRLRKVEHKLDLLLPGRSGEVKE
jgi:hypothetical protein